MTSKNYDISWTREVLNDRYQRTIRHPDYQSLCDEYSAYPLLLSDGSKTITNFFDDTGFENKMLLLEHLDIDMKFNEIKDHFGLDSIVHYQFPISPEELLSHPIFKEPTAVHVTYAKEERDGIIELSPVWNDGTMHLLIYASSETPKKQILDELTEQIRSARESCKFGNRTAGKADTTTYTVDDETGFCKINLDIRPPLTFKSILTTVNDIISEAKSHLADNRNRLKENALAYQAYDLRLNYTTLPMIAVKLGHKMTDRQFALTKLLRGYTLIHGQSFDKMHMRRLMEENIEKKGDWQAISNLTPSLKEKLHTNYNNHNGPIQKPPPYETYTLEEREHRLRILDETLAFCDDCINVSCSSEMQDGYAGLNIFRKDLACGNLNKHIYNLSIKLPQSE